MQKPDQWIPTLGSFWVDSVLVHHALYQDDVMFYDGGNALWRAWADKSFKQILHLGLPLSLLLTDRSALWN